MVLENEKLNSNLGIMAGCIFVELYTGCPLFPGKNHNDQLWHVMKGIGRLTDHQMRFLRKDSQLASFRQPLPHEHVPLEARWGENRQGGITPDKNVQHCSGYSCGGSSE